MLVLLLTMLPMIVNKVIITGQVNFMLLKTHLESATLSEFQMSLNTVLHKCRKVSKTLNAVTTMK